MKYWYGLAGPFDTLEEAEHFATISGGSPSDVYVCNESGEVLA